MEDNFVEKLKKYFNETPREKVLEDWKKSEEYDKIGPTMDEFMENTKKCRMKIDKQKRYLEMEQEFLQITEGMKQEPNDEGVIVCRNPNDVMIFELDLINKELAYNWDVVYKIFSIKFYLKFQQVNSFIKGITKKHFDWNVSKVVGKTIF